MNRATLTVASALAIAVPLAASSAAAPKSELSLTRKAFLGAQLQPAPDGGGVAVGNVVPGGTAEKLGIRTGDVITALNGTAVAAPKDVVAITRTLRQGAPIKISLRRASGNSDVSGKALGKPLEAYAGARVEYGAVPFRDGMMRDILVMPAGKPDAPVVYYIQGYVCSSIEAGQGEDLYRRFGEELIARGIGYYRVEKLGMGDSIGTLKCEDVDFATELDGFRAAYKHLVTQHGIAADRIFMLGHSMGGLQAPFLAAETAPRGIAVYGIGVRNWADYYQELVGTQSFLIGGQDPVDVEHMGEATRQMVREFYLEGKTPQQIAAENPGSEKAVRDILVWDGGNNVFGRSYKFAQDLPKLEVVEAWKKSRTNVLAMYGESDMVALTDEEHRYLADIVNYWRPGSGKFVTIPNSDHPMNVVGSRDEVRARNRAGMPPLPPKFSVSVVEVFARWIQEVMAKAPIGGA